MDRKEAINVIRKNYPHVTSSGSQFETALRTLIPELKESEDERIRQEILDYIVKATGCKRWVDWLEKQGEQKPFWSEEDEENLNWFEKFFRAESVIVGGKDIPQDKYLWFKDLKDRVQPQKQWKPSEEQMDALNDVISSRDIKYDVLSELWKDLKQL